MIGILKRLIMAFGVLLSAIATAAASPFTGSFTGVYDFSNWQIGGGSDRFGFDLSNPALGISFWCQTTQDDPPYLCQIGTFIDVPPGGGGHVRFYAYGDTRVFGPTGSDSFPVPGWVEFDVNEGDRFGFEVSVDVCCRDEIVRGYVTVGPVPEPSPFLLVAAGIFVAVAGRHRLRWIARSASVT